MDTIWSYLFASKQSEEEKIHDLLKNTPIFEGLSKNQLRSIRKLLHERQYRAGEVVFSIDEPGVGMYIVCEGEVAVYISDHDALEPTETKVATIHQGEFFGEFALFGTYTRTATIRATKNSKLLGLVRPEFMDLIKRDSKMGCHILMRLLTLVGQRLESTNEQLSQARRQLVQLKDQKAKLSLNSLQHNLMDTMPLESFSAEWSAASAVPNPFQEANGSDNYDESDQVTEGSDDSPIQATMEQHSEPSNADEASVETEETDKDTPNASEQGEAS